MDWSLVASALLGAAAIIVGTALLIGRYRRTSARRYALRSLPPLVIPASDHSLAVAAQRPALVGSRAAWRDRQMAQSVTTDGAADAAAGTLSRRDGEPWARTSRGGGAMTVDGPPEGGEDETPIPTLEAGGAMERALEAERTVRLQRPMEETLQFLPGRLEVTEGEDRGQTIRFVRHFGEVPVVTFGRSAGPAHRHVQLRSLTVSRLQARMRYEARHWVLTNLSETNPTLVNGEELSVHATRALEHGDRIEMGEVVFRFWEY